MKAGGLSQNYKPVVRAGVCEVDDQLEGFMTEGFEREDDMVDEEITVGFADLVATCNVVKNRISGSRSSGLKKQSVKNTNRGSVLVH
jgi:hypothetical protein